VQTLDDIILEGEGDSQAWMRMMKGV